MIDPHELPPPDPALENYVGDLGPVFEGFLWAMWWLCCAGVVACIVYSAILWWRYGP